MHRCASLFSLHEQQACSINEAFVSLAHPHTLITEGRNLQSASHTVLELCSNFSIIKAHIFFQELIRIVLALEMHIFSSNHLFESDHLGP